MTGADSDMEEIAGIVGQAKIDYDDPLVVVGGDFNEFKPDQLTTAYPELVKARSPPTRIDSKIDLLLTNFNSCIKEAASLQPLSNEDGQLSDHNVVYFRAELPKKKPGR